MRQNQINPTSRNQQWIEDCSGTNWDNDAYRAVELSTVTEDAVLSMYQNEQAIEWIDPVPEVEPISALAVPMGVSLESQTAPRARLDGSDLSGCDLRNADFCGASLTKVRFNGARLDHANLQGSDLRGADLRGCNLQFANLKQAQLYGALLNERTKLPISKDEAIQLGMNYIAVAEEGQ